MRAAATGLAVEGTDVITAVTGTCPAIVVTIRDTPVTVGLSTVLGTGTTCAGLIVGATVHVTGVLTFATGGAASVAATSISLDGGVAPVSETVTGTVASITGTCPSVTLTLQGAAGVVVTSSTTTFTPSGSCGTIAAGQIIEAHGARNSAAQLAATDLAVVTEDPTVGAPIGHGHKVGGEGTAANVTGTCPALSMVVLGVHVTTSASTTFVGACGTIRNGTKLLVEGNQQSDGRVIATSVRITDQPGKGR